MSPDSLTQLLMGRFAPHDVPYMPEPAPAQSPRHLAMVLAYCGDEFAGWQVQPRRATVQGSLESALSKICNQPVRIQASGRTDAGVHALGQVAHFSTGSRLGLETLAHGLRSIVGPRVLLRALGQVEPEFHARYSVRAKTYAYYLWPQAKAPLFMQNRLWSLPKPLNPEPVRRALAGIIGDRDLAALASAGSEVQGSTVRTIFAAELSLDEHGIWCLRIKASGFLRHVVRNLVGVLYQIGRGDLQPEQLHEMLAAGKRLYAGPKAPPGGLYLEKVFYRAPGFEPCKEIK